MMESEKFQTSIFHKDIDIKSGISTYLTSILIKYFAPVDFVIDQNLSMMTQSACSGCFGHLIYGKNTPKTSHQTGSIAEGLAVPDFMRVSQKGQQISRILLRDVDEMVLEENKFCITIGDHPGYKITGPMFEVEANEESPENYAFLRVTDEYKQTCELEGKPLKCDYLFNKTVLTSLKSTWDRMLPGGTLSSYVHQSRQGPSISQIHHTQHTPGRDRDQVHGITFRDFPEVATEWITRLRPSKWPSEDTVYQVIECGHQMVPVGRHGSPTVDKEWRYSFSLAEKILAKSLSPGQRHVYILLKMLHGFNFSEPKVIPTYCLKTLLFWISERVPAHHFHEDNVGKMLMFFLDELLLALSKRCLSHYFIRSVNLLEGIPFCHLKTVYAKVQFVRKNLVKCILSLDKTTRFFAISHKAKLSTAFPDRLLKPLTQANLYDGLVTILESYLVMIKSLDTFPQEMAAVKPIQKNVWVKLIYQVIKDIRLTFQGGKKMPIQPCLIYVLSLVTDKPQLIAEIVIHVYCMEFNSLLRKDKKNPVLLDIRDSELLLKTAVRSNIDQAVKYLTDHLPESNADCGSAKRQKKIELIKNVQAISKVLEFPQRKLLDNSFLYSVLYEQQVKNSFSALKIIL